MGRHPAAVVGHQDTAGRPQRALGRRPGRGGVGPAVPGVQPGHRPAGGPDPDLARRAAAQRHPNHFHVPAEQVAQPRAVAVVAERRDQHHIRAAQPRRQARGQHRGQPGASGPVPLPVAVDHRDRGVRGQPLGRPVQVHVEQRVADDHQRAALHADSGSVIRCTRAASTAASTAAHSM